MLGHHKTKTRKKRSGVPEKRNGDYLKLVHTLPCVISGLSCVSAHHPRHGQGMGQKSPDWYAFPLSYPYHQGQYGMHTIGTKAWQRIYGQEMMFAKKTQLALKDKIDIPEEFRLY